MHYLPANVLVQTAGAKSRVCICMGSTAAGCSMPALRQQHLCQAARQQPASHTIDQYSFTLLLLWSAACHIRFESSIGVCTCCDTYCSYIRLQGQHKQVAAHRGWHIKTSKPAILHLVMYLVYNWRIRWRRLQGRLQVGRCRGGRASLARPAPSLPCRL